MSDQHLANDQRVWPEAIAADIAAELRAHPEHWTKNELARGSNGRCTSANDPNAVCWCLEGHISRRVEYGARDAIFKRFKNALGRVIFEWNDESGRTVADVIGLCDEISKPGAGFAAFRAYSLTALGKVKP